MRLVDINATVSLSDTRPVRIRLEAKLEDVVQGYQVEIGLHDIVLLESVDLQDFSDEWARIAEEHPFFKLRLCESPIELRFFAYAMHRIPGLRPQVVVGPYRVDLAIPEKRVAIELDGHQFHSTPQQRTRDAKRERFLQREGWQVIRFTGTEIHKDVLGCIDEAIETIAKLPVLR